MARKQNKNSELLAILGEKPIAFNASLAQVVGSATSGLFMSQMLYWCGKGRDKEWVYKTIREFEEETCLTRSEQVRAIRSWKKLGVLEVELRGLPRKRHFRIDEARLTDLVCKHLAEKRRQYAENDKLVCRKPHAITESTHENTNIYSAKHAAEQMSDIRSGVKAISKKLSVNHLET
ncbi:MAG: hypothetical protein ACYC48_01525 [Minisyncoccota bacterium]